MKAKSKATAGLVVMLGFPAAFAVALTAIAIGFAHQHVRDRHVHVISDTQATVRVHDFHHSAAGIAGLIAGLSLLWLAALALCVLAGGAMIDSRNRSWE